MGQGGYITLVNGTKSDWVRKDQHSYQMNSWDFPNTVQAMSSVSVYVEWNQAPWHEWGDDGGDATYQLQGTDLEFWVQASGRNEFHLQIAFTNIATHGNPRGSVLNLGWIHNGAVNFILSGEPGCLSSSNPPISWMQSNMSLLQERTLREICIPGSHDSGMSIYTSGTTGTNDCNTLTQSTGIKGQLQYGARYFDIRPVISDGQYLTGHYGHIEMLGIGTWQGANGQSISSIIDDINTFTADNKELVILYLSHDLNTDLGNNAYAPFTQTEWNKMFKLLEGIHNLFITESSDLTMLKLRDFIGGNRAAVVVIVDADREGISLDGFANRGFYTPAHFLLYNKYSKNNDVHSMMKDQFDKLKNKHRKVKYFLLSWTLTLSSGQAIQCATLPGVLSIRDLANIANPYLYTKLMSNCTKECYPNILYTDNILSSDIAALAMAVNSLATLG
jgi:hypothetical protein